MKNIIATLIISTVILGLTMMGIDLWRNNLELMRVTAVKTSELEKVQRTNLIPIDKEQLSGSEVISLIRYYSHDPEVVVVVSIDGLEKTYDGEKYRQNYFNIPYEMYFEKNALYEGKKLKKLTFYKIR